MFSTQIYPPSFNVYDIYFVEFNSLYFPKKISSLSFFVKFKTFVRTDISEALKSSVPNRLYRVSLEIPVFSEILVIVIPDSSIFFFNNCVLTTKLFLLSVEFNSLYHLCESMSTHFNIFVESFSQIWYSIFRKGGGHLLALYKNIKKRREELEMSQDELAKKTGYTSRSSIAKIEKGLVDLTQTKISLFAQALKTTSSDLMGWKETEDKSNLKGQSYYLNKESHDAAQFLYDNPNYRVLFDATRKVKPEDIDFVKQMIDKMNGNN